MSTPEESKSERLEFQALPAVADLETKTKQRVIAALELLDQVSAQKAVLEAREEELKAELERLQLEAGRPGFRYGWLCFASVPTKGRKTLDKMLLLENGCPASVLNASYKTGEPGTRCTFKRLSEET